jgi:hypothetical protein
VVFWATALSTTVSAMGATAVAMPVAVGFSTVGALTARALGVEGNEVVRSIRVDMG